MANSSSDAISTEQLLAGGIAAVVAVVAWTRRDTWLPVVGQWLQQQHILARPGEGIIDLGAAGSVDELRIALAVGLLVVIATLASLYRRRSRRDRAADNET